MLSPWNASEKGNNLEKPAVQSPDHITPLCSRLRPSLGTAGLQGATLIRLCLSWGATVPENAMEWCNTVAAHHFFNWDLLKVHACFREPLGSSEASSATALQFNLSLCPSQLLFQPSRCCFKELPLLTHPHAKLPCRGSFLRNESYNSTWEKSSKCLTELNTLFSSANMKQGQYSKWLTL